MTGVVSRLCAIALLFAPMAGLLAQSPGSPEVQKLLDEAHEDFKAYATDVSRLDRSLEMLQAADKLEPRNPEVLWRLARLYFKKGEEVPGEGRAVKKQRVAFYEQSIAWGEKLLALDRDSIEGTYWVAVGKARLADLKGVFSAMGLIGEVKEGLDRTIQLCLQKDPKNDFLPLSYIVRGAVYRETPGIAGGSNRKALEHIRKGLEIDPQLTIGWTELAKTHVDEENWQEAKDAVQRVLNEQNPRYPWDWTRYDKPTVQKLLPEIEEELAD
jgi:tetratricopeptide (TPR) repeat protein